MKVHVNTIQNDRLVVPLSDEQAWCVAACARATDGDVTAISGELCLTVRSMHVDAHGAVRVAVDRSCDRCGETTSLHLRDVFELAYYPEETLTDEERELAVDDLGVGWFEKDTIDLEQVLCEIICLTLPNRVLCSEESACDARLKSLLGEAQVERLTGHPGFAALKGFGKDPRG